MFTGIIQAKGRLRQSLNTGGDQRIEVETPAKFLAGVQLGDSISTQGVCLTVVGLAQDRFAADVSAETLRLTTLGSLLAGNEVNLEKALTLQTPLGGHLVSGHVDGVGIIESRREDARSVRFRVRAPSNLTRYIAARGSITVDGISLTVNSVDGEAFDLNLVPHSLHLTTASVWGTGRRVNLEVDVIARYLERLITKDTQSEYGGISQEMLMRCGYMG